MIPSNVSINNHATTIEIIQNLFSLKFQENRPVFSTITPAMAKEMREAGKNKSSFKRPQIPESEEYTNWKRSFDAKLISLGKMIDLKDAFLEMIETSSKNSSWHEVDIYLPEEYSQDDLLKALASAALQPKEYDGRSALLHSAEEYLNNKTIQIQQLISLKDWTNKCASRLYWTIFKSFAVSNKIYDLPITDMLMTKAMQCRTYQCKKIYLDIKTPLVKPLVETNGLSRVSKIRPWILEQAYQDMQKPEAPRLSINEVNPTKVPKSFPTA